MFHAFLKTFNKKYSFAKHCKIYIKCNIVYLKSIFKSWINIFEIHLIVSFLLIIFLRKNLIKEDDSCRFFMRQLRTQVPLICKVTLFCEFLGLPIATVSMSFRDLHPVVRCPIQHVEHCSDISDQCFFNMSSFKNTYSQQKINHLHTFSFTTFIL